MRKSLPLSALLVALTGIGCAPLPHALTENRDTIVPIDVALEPVARPDDRATPGPHMTLVRAFVRGNDLHPFSAAVASVLATTTLEELHLETTSAATVANVSPELRRLEERMVEALRPFAVNPETAKDFIVTPDGSRMSDATIRAVERFVPDASGVNYKPAATFTPAGAAMFQLGGGGTPERRLWTWTGENGAREP